MEIQTKYHGKIHISSKDIVKFENGIPGFPRENEFYLLPIEDAEFQILQSTNTANLAFVIVNPFNYFPQYDFTIEDSVVAQLGISHAEDVSVYTILTVKEPFENTTANLQAPIVINSKNQQAKQVVLNVDHYSTRHKIIEKRLG